VPWRQILQPLSHAEAHDVHAHGEATVRERHQLDEHVVVAQVHKARAGGVGRNCRVVIEERRK